jgi:hypothetical protein
VTTVINVRGHHRLNLIGREDFRYCGRACWGWPASPFSNPFVVGWPADKVRRAVERHLPGVEYASGEPLRARDAVDLFVVLLGRDREMQRRLPELVDKRLGCWCLDWRPGQPIKVPCHAVHLARMVNALFPEGAPCPNPGG